MDEKFKAGGIVNKPDDDTVLVNFHCCPIFIPIEVARKWREQLDRLNEDVVE